MEKDTKSMETILRSELHELRLEWRKTVKEWENGKKALREMEMSRKELEAQLARCQREGNAQRQHIEAVGEREWGIKIEMDLIN
jgi:chromosome segregation ATPase